MFQGSIVAMVTPFDKNDNLNEDEVRKLAQFHKNNGTNGILVSGCTGESFTLDEDERMELLHLVKKEVAGEIPVIVGTGASSTKLAVKRTARAKDDGADAVLVITPFGNKPSEKAKLDYYTELNAIGIPIILYNVPSRTGTNMAAETVVELAELPNINAIKEASGDLDKVTKILKNADISVLSGDDSLTLPMLALGAKGVISTVANVVPGDMSGMVAAFFEGNLSTARKLHFKMFDLIKTLFIEGNPAPLKTALKLIGLIEGHLRPPLAELTPGNLATLKTILTNYGLI